MKKVDVDRIKKIGVFLHEAFCVNGKIEFIEITKPTPEFSCDGLLYQIQDKKRGLFFVAIYKPIDRIKKVNG
jgi:hypothetical protein